MLKKNDLKEVIIDALDRAENCWSKTGHYFQLNEKRNFAKTRNIINDSSSIPGFEKLKWEDFDKGSFIALFADMRDSSLRFTQALSGWHPPEKRVLYETLGMLAMFDFVIDYYDGMVTEFLGDGCLALYHIPDDSSEKEKQEIFHKAWKAANGIVGIGLETLNECFTEIKLKEAKIGVGVACSRAVVVRVGTSSNQVPKIVGACVYKASKLSYGENEVIVDKSFDVGWPGSSGGTWSFQKTSQDKISAKNREHIIPMKKVVTK